MFFADLPDSFGGADITAAAVIAAKEEQSYDGLMEFGRRLQSRGTELGDGVGQLVACDGLVCQYDMAGPEQARTSGFLVAMVVFNGAEFPPPPPTFPDSVRPYFESRAGAARHPQLEARYNDFLWLRWKDHHRGRTARAAYVAAGEGADLDDAESAMESMEALARAAQLALTFKEEVDATREVVAREVRRGLAADSLGHACMLAERTAGLLAGDRDVAARLTVEFMASAEKASSQQQFHRERSYLESGEILAKDIGDNEIWRECHVRRARSFEAEAGASDKGMLAQHWLREAIAIHAELGNIPEVERLKPLMTAASEKMVGEMKPIGATVEVPKEEIAKAADATTLAKEASPLALLKFPEEVGLWPAWAEVERATEVDAAAHPLLAFMPHTRVEPDGRVQPEPEDPAEREAARHVRAFSQRIQFGLAGARLIVDELRGRGAWDADLVIRAISLADLKLGEAAAAGVHLHEQGEHWAAVHVLVPQLERAVRGLGRAADADVARLTPDSGYRWAALEQLLSDPAIAAALGQDLTRELEAVLINPHGLNMRNNLAHGGLDPGTDAESLARLALMALITVAYRMVQQAERARGDPQPDP